MIRLRCRKAVVFASRLKFVRVVGWGFVGWGIMGLLFGNIEIGLFGIGATLIVLDLLDSLWDRVVERRLDKCTNESHWSESIFCRHCDMKAEPMILYAPGLGRRYIVICQECSAFLAYGMDY